MPVRFVLIRVMMAHFSTTVHAESQVPRLANDCNLPRWKRAIAATEPLVVNPDTMT